MTRHIEGGSSGAQDRPHRYDKTKRSKSESSREVPYGANNPSHPGYKPLPNRRRRSRPKRSSNSGGGSNNSGSGSNTSSGSNYSSNSGGSKPSPEQRFGLNSPGRISGRGPDKHKKKHHKGKGDGKGKGHGKGDGRKHGGSGRGRGGRGGSGSGGNLESKAASLVDADIADQLRAILGFATRLKNERGDALEGVRNTGQRTRADLRKIFGEVLDYTKAQNKLVNESYRSNREAVGNIYDEGNAEAAAIGTEQTNALNAQLGVTGFNEAATRGDFDSNIALNNAMARDNKANALGNLMAQQQSSRAIQGLMGGAIVGERGSQIGQSWNAQNDAATAVKDLFQNELIDLQGEAMDVRKSRGQMYQELLLQLEDTAYNRWAEQRQLNFQNRLASNQFNLGVDQMNWDRNMTLAELEQQAAQFRTGNRISRRGIRQNRRHTRQDTGAGAGNIYGGVNNVANNVLDRLFR